MYNDSDNVNNGLNETDDLDYSFNCLNCPYFVRQMNPPPPPFQGNPQFPGGPPNQGGTGYQHQGPPGGPPPAHTPRPQEGASLHAVSPGSIRPCTYRYVYIWLENGRSFWAWLTNVDRRTATGWRWDGRRWVYFGIDLRRIESFVCY